MAVTFTNSLKVIKLQFILPDSKKHALLSGNQSFFSVLR